jgi:hypothetical protein
MTSLVIGLLAGAVGFVFGFLACAVLVSNRDRPSGGSHTPPERNPGPSDRRQGVQ